MNILILNGSPRPKGNTAAMIAAFAEGAVKSGHALTTIEVCKKRIGGCLGCEYCHTKGHGACIQQDDMTAVYAALREADMLILASPIYYHNISGQLKCTVDRFYAVAYPEKPAKLKKVALFLSSGDANMYDGALFSYRGDFLEYLGLTDMGVFTVHGAVSPAKREELRAFGAGLR